MESVRKTLMIPMDILKRIEEYQRENYITSFSMATIQLIIKGLES